MSATWSTGPQYVPTSSGPVIARVGAGDVGAARGRRWPRPPAGPHGPSAGRRTRERFRRRRRRSRRSARPLRLGSWLGNLHGIRRSRSCDVVSIRRRAASTARSGAWVGPALEPRSSGAFERAIVGHARRPSRAIGLRFGREGVAEPARGVVQSRSGRARGDLEQLGDLHERQPEVVVQDEDRPLIDREPAERPLQLVAVGDGRRCRPGSPAARSGRTGRWPSRARPLRLVVAGVDEDPMDPGLEAVGFPQVRDPAPGEHEGVLQRVLGETRVAQDPLGDRVERIADLVHQDGERLTIALTGLLDEVSIHLDLRWSRPVWPRSPTMTGLPGRNVQMCRPTSAAATSRIDGPDADDIPDRVATNVSRRSMTGQTWFGMTATTSPRVGRAPPFGSDDDAVVVAHPLDDRVGVGGQRRRARRGTAQRPSSGSSHRHR